MMLKRAGHGHDPGGANATGSGALAIRCPACPHPGINLPDDWESAPKEYKFIYTLFLALDACFRLKRGLVSSELKDPGLGTGWAYFVENEPYREYLLTVTDQKEMTTCSGLAALDYANTKFSRGYSSTGVGMGVCARHELIQLNGVGDLQRGERFANMDYIYGSILRYHNPSLPKTTSYDIVCVWWIWLMDRLKELPPLVRCVIFLPIMCFVIPKMHINGHGWFCGVTYSLNLKPGSSQTDGEGIEHPWANIGGIASSTRIMGPGARHDTINDHWGHWNWQKLVGLAEMLRRKLDTALEEQVVQQEALDTFSEEQKDQVDAWKKMIHDFEDKKSMKNPYEVVVVGLTEAEVQLQFQKDEEVAAKKGLPSKHRVSPSEFMVESLEVEAEQREVRVQAELKKKQTTSQQIDMAAVRTKLIRRLERLRKLQRTYSPASIVAVEQRTAPTDEQPEDEPLFMPSALSAAQRADGGCTKGLLEMELLMRDAQCRAALEKLRNQLVIKGCFFNYKSLHARNQGATTRARGIVGRNEAKIRLHSEKYQAAWTAILIASGGTSPRWLEDANNIAVKEAKRQRAKEKRKGKYQELVSHGVDMAVCVEEENDGDEGGDEGGGRKAGESRREVSWIWKIAGSSGTDGIGEALRIEWSKTYMHSRRWNEEVLLLKEEFQRLPISLNFEADRWAERAQAAADPARKLDAASTQGIKAYALNQEALFRELATRARDIETAPKVGKGKKCPRVGITDSLMDREEDDEDEQEEEIEVDEGPELIESDEELVMGGEVDNI
ncbi:hypothetical protein K438DRAFT_1985004 [Mycena galopus ATCC 62051]|nr:hypothetical protein K438DRAFT_1985004 [Mycena galopus ATCC 62051]